MQENQTHRILSPFRENERKEPSPLESRNINFLPFFLPCRGGKQVPRCSYVSIPLARVLIANTNAVYGVSRCMRDTQREILYENSSGAKFERNHSRSKGLGISPLSLSLSIYPLASVCLCRTRWPSGSRTRRSLGHTRRTQRTVRKRRTVPGNDRPVDVIPIARQPADFHRTNFSRNALLCTRSIRHDFNLKREKEREG